MRSFEQSHAKAKQTTDCWPRVLAVLLLGLLLVWVLLGKVGPSGAACGWTVGQEAPASEAHEFCDWFVSR